MATVIIILRALYPTHYSVYSKASNQPFLFNYYSGKTEHKYSKNLNSNIIS